MGLKIVTAAATYPVTLAEAKAQQRVGHSDDDAIIQLFINAATEYAESFLGRALIEQTWDLYLDAFPTNGEIEIPLPPTIEVLGLFYLDSNNVEQEFPAASYVIDYASEPARVKLANSANWPTISLNANAVRARFRAGYLDASSPPVANVPFDIRAAILLHVGALYAHREEVVVGQTAVLLPWGADALLRRKRKHLGMA